VFNKKANVEHLKVGVRMNRSGGCLKEWLRPMLRERLLWVSKKMASSVSEAGGCLEVTENRESLGT
jgi:hypothetical protein